MFRLLGRIDIEGKKDSIEKCASLAAIPNATMVQIGQKKKIPEVDAWLYASPWYKFNHDAMASELCDFLTAHLQIRDALNTINTGISYAFLTLCPVTTGNGDAFSGIFSSETLKLLVKVGLELQIAPATIMPDAPLWKNRSL